MRALALLVALLLTMTGCLTEPGVKDELNVETEDFDDADASWVAMYSSGCGMCPGQTGFAAPADHFAVFLFGNDRAMHVTFNGGWNGVDDFHVPENVSYNHDELAALLDHVPRADGGEVWVVTVETGRVGPDGVSKAILDEWATTRTGDACTDYGADYAVNPPDADSESQQVVCPVTEGDPLYAFASDMHAIRERLRPADDA